jgi:hypothetical protein
LPCAWSFLKPQAKKKSNPAGLLREQVLSYVYHNKSFHQRGAFIMGVLVPEKKVTEQTRKLTKAGKRSGLRFLHREPLIFARLSYLFRSP